MRLTDLDPRWVGHGGEGTWNADGSPIPWREKVGISFRCPCGQRFDGESDRIVLTFSNPIDGGPPVGAQPHWDREGNDFETLTLKPFIRRVGGCAWHGFLTNGEVTTC